MGVGGLRTKALGVSDPFDVQPPGFSSGSIGHQVSSVQPSGPASQQVSGALLTGSSLGSSDREVPAVDSSVVSQSCDQVVTESARASFGAEQPTVARVGHRDRAQSSDTLQGQVRGADQVGHAMAQLALQGPSLGVSQQSEITRPRRETGAGGCVRIIYLILKTYQPGRLLEKSECEPVGCRLCRNRMCQYLIAVS